MGRSRAWDGDAPKIFLRDRHSNFGASFDRVAEGVGTRVIKTAVRAPDLDSKDVSITASGTINAKAFGDLIIKGSKVSKNSKHLPMPQGVCDGRN
jgi:hypothetical protein